MTVESIFSTSRTVQVFEEEDDDEDIAATKSIYIRVLIHGPEAQKIKVVTYHFTTGTAYHVKSSLGIRLANQSRSAINKRFFTLQSSRILLEGTPEVPPFIFVQRAADIDEPFERKEEMNKLAWLERLEIKHKTWLVIITFMGFIGLLDLMLFIISGITILHWLNDVLLMIGSLGLAATVVMVAMEE